MCVSPIGIQFAWGLILGIGLFCLRDSPRYFVKKGQLDKARAVLDRLRGQSPGSQLVKVELAKIVANAEVEARAIPTGKRFASWRACFSGSVFKSSSNLRRTILGTSLQMMQQWTGVNFMQVSASVLSPALYHPVLTHAFIISFYFSTQFLSSTGARSDPFITSMIFTIVNVVSTPISFYTVEKFGRGPLLIWGVIGMMICQFLVAIIGVTIRSNKTYVNEASEALARNIAVVNAHLSVMPATPITPRRQRSSTP
ncbi:hypothetical protein JCM10449v2_004070 [Rhodotorula kratochvilovae]